MAASDPSPYVATPTGTLQGVAAFSWDGSAWQPTGRAGPDVATPTGVLQGVAPFSWSGSAWTPAGVARPGVATPSGVLDGVAVYTWSGSAWTPTGGTATPSTPSGVLRGVAAFSWDGAAWQPSGQAGPSVPTPYGVLAGVAMFEWSGSSWQAGAAVPAGASLDLSFLSGTLDPRITFTRASTATYFDAGGTMRTAALNVLLNSGDASNASWTPSSGNGVGSPTVTANQVVAPDGTTTAARVVYPAMIVGGAFSYLNPASPTPSAAVPYVFSVYLRGAVGGEQVWLFTTPDGVLYYRTAVVLTTAWQRYVLATPNLTGTVWFFGIGRDGRDTSQGPIATPAQTAYMWGGQLEIGTAASVYIPTTTAPNGAPRFDYDPVTHAARGLLIEEARTNIWLQSADASNAAWVPASSGGPVVPVVTGNQTNAPDGTLTAARVVYPAVNVASSYSVLYQAVTATANPYAFTVWLKGSAGGEQIYVGSLSGPGTRATLTTQWQRFVYLPSLSAGTNYLIVGTDLRGGQTSTPAQTIYVWGGQVEQGAFPTSYIPTTSAAVTRSADQCRITAIGSAPWFNAAQGALQLEYDSGNLGAVTGGMSDGSTANMIYCGQNGGMNCFVATVSKGITVSPVLAYPAANKSASCYQANRFSGAINGGTVLADATIPAGPFLWTSTLSIGSSPWALDAQLGGHMRRVRYWPRALSDAELQSVTT